MPSSLRSTNQEFSSERKALHRKVVEFNVRLKELFGDLLEIKMDALAQLMADESSGKDDYKTVSQPRGRKPAFIWKRKLNRRIYQVDRLKQLQAKLADVDAENPTSYTVREMRTILERYIAADFEEGVEECERTIVQDSVDALIADLDKTMIDFLD